MRLIKRRHRNGQSGITLIELMIAGVVLVVGMLGAMILISTAIANNGRNKMDSTGTMIAQAVFEQIKSTIIGTGTSTLSDCAGNTFTIDTAIGGAPLSSGAVDYTQAQVTNYSMNFVVCAGNSQATYDVRWNVNQLTTTSYLVTVSSRLKGAGTSLKYFALPVTLRGTAGN